MNHLLSNTYDPERATKRDYIILKSDIASNISRLDIDIEEIFEDRQTHSKAYRDRLEALRDQLAIVAVKSEVLENIMGGLMRQGIALPISQVCTECGGKGEKRYPYPSRRDPDCEMEWETCLGCGGEKVILGVSF